MGRCETEGVVAGGKRERRGAAEMIITELLATVALAAYLLPRKRLFVKTRDTPARRGDIKLNGGFPKSALDYDVRFSRRMVVRRLSLAPF